MTRILLIGFLAGFLGGCGGKPDASTLTHPKRLYAFPMYITVPGTSAGTGAIFRVSDSDVNAVSELETVLTGLDFPAGLTVDTDGTIFFTERPTLTTGKIMRLRSGEAAATEYATGLTTPEGITLDRASRLFVTERNLNRVSRVDSEGVLETIYDSLTGPTAITSDKADNLIITEPAANRVSKVIPDGTREDLLTDVTNPLFAGPAGRSTYVLSNNAGLGEGSALEVPEGGVNSSYLTNLINPKSFAWEDGTILYVAEGAPTNRIIKYSTVSAIRTELVSLSSEPHTIAFTPLD